MRKKTVKPDHLSVAAGNQTGSAYVKACFIHYFFKTVSVALIVYVALNSSAIEEVLPELIAKVG